MFFKPYMELDFANMTQIMCFESRVIRKLLDNFESSNHDRSIPLFYKMQIQNEGKVQIVNPIDIALDENQVRALNSIITYCVKYQNSYSFSFMFE